MSPSLNLQSEQRALVVGEAHTWLRTKFHDCARVKGEGVDCANLLIGVYAAADVISEFEPERYSPQWHLHRSEEKFLQTIERFAHEIPGPPEPGDVALFQFARCFSHGAIVIKWPTIIHAYVGRGVEICDVSKDGHFIGRRTKFFSAW